MALQSKKNCKLVTKVKCTNTQKPIKESQKFKLKKLMRKQEHNIQREIESEFARYGVNPTTVKEVEALIPEYQELSVSEKPKFVKKKSFRKRIYVKRSNPSNG